jgi:hypothetical protein
MKSQSTDRQIRRVQTPNPPELPTIIIQIAILIGTCIHCFNFSLQYSRYLHETQAPESLPALQIRSR